MQLDIKQIQASVNAGFDIDNTLKELSLASFEIDEESRLILRIIATYSKLTEHQLGKRGTRDGLNRDSVRRRIYGTESLVSLVDENFLVPVSQYEFVTGETVRMYDLTMKGILASLANIRFEDTYHLNKFYQFLLDLTANKFHVVDFFVLYAKYHMALIMLWHKMNELYLTRFRKIDSLFLEPMTKHILFDFIPNPSISKREWTRYTELGTRFFTIKHVLTTLIKELSNKEKQYLKNKHIVNFLQSKSSSQMEENRLYELLRGIMIKHWRSSFIRTSRGLLTTTDITIIEDAPMPIQDQRDFWLQERSRINELSKGIFDKLKLENATKMDMETFE